MIRLDDDGKRHLSESFDFSKVVYDEIKYFVGEMKFSCYLGNIHAHHDAISGDCIIMSASEFVNGWVYSADKKELSVEDIKKQADKMRAVAKMLLSAASKLD